MKGGRKRRSRGRSRSSHGGGGGSGKITRSQGWCYVETTITAATGSNIQLRPDFLPRELQISDSFQLYRFTHLNVEVLPFTVSGTNNETYQAYGFMPAGVVSSAPDTLLEVSQCRKVVVQSCVNYVGTSLAYNAGLTTPKHLILSRADLLGDNSLKWWKTQNTTGVDQWDFTQGYIFIGTNRSVTGVTKCLVRYNIEYTGPSPTTATLHSFTGPSIESLEKAAIKSKEMRDFDSKDEPFKKGTISSLQIPSQKESSSFEACYLGSSHGKEIDDSCPYCNGKGANLS